VSNTWTTYSTAHLTTSQPFYFPFFTYHSNRTTVAFIKYPESKWKFVKKKRNPPSLMPSSFYLRPSPCNSLIYLHVFLSHDKYILLLFFSSYAFYPERVYSWLLTPHHCSLQAPHLFQLKSKMLTNSLCHVIMLSVSSNGNEHNIWFIKHYHEQRIHLHIGAIFWK